MKAILLDVIQNDRTVASRAKLKPGAPSFAASLKESCSDDLNPVRPASPFPGKTNGAFVANEVPARMTVDESSTTKQADAVEDTDLAPSGGLKERALSDSELPRREQCAGSQSDPTCRETVMQKHCGEPKNDEVNGAGKEARAATIRKKNEKEGRPVAESGGTPTTTEMPAVIHRNEDPALVCDPGGGAASQSTPGSVRNENGAKLRLISGNGNSSVGGKSLWMSEKRVSQESREHKGNTFDQGTVPRQILSVRSKVLAEGQEEKNPSINRNGGIAEKIEPTSGEFSRATTCIEGKAEGLGMMMSGSVDTGTQIGQSHLPADGGLLVKDKLVVDPTTEVYGASFVDSHGREQRNGPSVGADSDPMLLGASPKVIEVGVVSSIHGWLKIRAEIEQGVVSASLTAKSSAAQEMLHRELPTLNAFLQEGKFSGGVIEVKQSSSTYAGDMGFGGGTQGRERSMHQQSSQKSEETISASDSAGAGGEQVGVFKAWSGVDKQIFLLPAMTNGMGGWLNVRV